MDKIDNIISLIQDLNYKEWSVLFEKLGLGKAAYLRNATIAIYDIAAPYDETPIAEIKYYNEETEIIDIVETVKQNAPSIAHPAIAVAIRRWERIITQLKRMPPELETDLIKQFADQFSLKPLELVQIANNHLARLREAFEDGIEERTEHFPKETLTFYFTNRLLEENKAILLRAKELLNTNFKALNNKDSKLSKLRFALYAEQYTGMDYNNINDETHEEAQRWGKNHNIDFIVDFFGGYFGSRHLRTNYKKDILFSHFLQYCLGDSELTINMDTLNKYKRLGKKRFNLDFINERKTLFVGGIPEYLDIVRPPQHATIESSQEEMVEDGEIKDDENYGTVIEDDLWDAWTKEFRKQQNSYLTRLDLQAASFGFHLPVVPGTKSP